MTPMELEKEAARIQDRLTEEVRVVCPPGATESEIAAVRIQLLVREIARLRLLIAEVAYNSVSNRRY
jgi:hypothetical protein